MTLTFQELNLNKKILHAIHDMGFEEPSPIQAAAIPLLMEGGDVIGQAQTGTGKTAAFGIPILEKLNPKYRGVQALVLTPTRELAIQVAEEIATIAKYKTVHVLPVYGGQSIDRQISALKRGVQVVIGTPGRLLDHLRRRTLRLDGVQMLVIDEADEMLDMGFIEDIEAILRETPENRQTLLFSATMPSEIQRLARRYMNEPKIVSVSRDELTVPLIEQVYFEVREKSKVEALCRILDGIEVTQAIIFCRTKRGVDELVAALQARGYSAEGLHGDLTQQQRDRVMRKVRARRLELLVATDVAARGLDIENVSHVINFDLPQDPEAYVHRIGRTGRAGRTGMAISLVEPREYRQLRLIEKLTKTRITYQRLPAADEITGRQRAIALDRLAQAMAGNSLSHYGEIVDDMATRYDLREIAAAALKLWLNPDEPEAYEDEGIHWEDTGARPGMVRLFTNIGREDELKPRDLLDVLAEETGVDGQEVGSINIFDRFTFFEVPRDKAERVLYSLHHINFKGRRISVAPAKARPARS